MESPQRTTTGKDIIRLEVGAKIQNRKETVKADGGISSAMNSEKGLVTGIKISGEVKDVVKGELSGQIYQDQMTGKTKIDGKSEVSFGKSTEGQNAKPSEEYTANGDGVSATINPKEFGRTVSDAVDGVKKYVQAEIDNIKKVLDGEH